LNKYQAPTQFIGRNTKYLDSCESTNSLALQECLENNIPEGFCYIADHQTKGRGQRGNRWDSHRGHNLLLSIVLQPKLSANQQFYLSKAIACGVVEGLKRWGNELGIHLPVSIKWPNDIYLAEKKIGGILIENQWNAGQWTYAIIGIGLNINQEEFGELRATSLKAFTSSSKEIDKATVFKQLCLGIENQYAICQTENFDQLDTTYHAHLLRLNEWHLYQEPDSQEIIDGKIIQVNEQGLLLVEKQNGYKLYDLKEIIFIFPS